MRIVQQNSFVRLEWKRDCWNGSRVCSICRSLTSQLNVAQIWFFFPAQMWHRSGFWMTVCTAFLTFHLTFSIPIWTSFKCGNRSFVCDVFCSVTLMSTFLTFTLIKLNIQESHAWFALHNVNVFTKKIKNDVTNYLNIMWKDTFLMSHHLNMRQHTTTTVFRLKIYIFWWNCKLWLTVQNT